MRLFLSRVHFPITTLGPGQRVGIWFQGCSIRCPGCISADTWALKRGETTVEQVIASIGPWLAQADGVTISGGEPFDQPEALVALLRGIRGRSPADILVFTGRPYEAVHPRLDGMTGLIDALITDPFEAATPQTRPLRGSDNQRLHYLTSLGREKFRRYERALYPEEKSLDVMFDDEAGTAWIAGIPNRNDMIKLRELLAWQGHDALTTDDRSPAGKAWR